MCVRVYVCMFLYVRDNLFLVRIERELFSSANCCVSHYSSKFWWRCCWWCLDFPSHCSFYKTSIVLLSSYNFLGDILYAISDCCVENEMHTMCVGVSTLELQREIPGERLVYCTASMELILWCQFRHFHRIFISLAFFSKWHNHNGNRRNQFGYLRARHCSALYSSGAIAMAIENLSFYIVKLSFCARIFLMPNSAQMRRWRQKIHSLPSIAFRSFFDLCLLLISVI